MANDKPDVASVGHCVKVLISISSKALHTPVKRTVADTSSECACGWKLANGRPEYICTTKTKRKKLQAVSPSSLSLCKSSTSVDAVVNSTSSTMGGKLSKDLDYVYSGGLSSRVRGNESPIVPATVKPLPQRRILTLNPVLQYRSDTMTDSSRLELSRLLQMQLKPDITYEQMIIEERLRTMNLAMNAQPALSIKSFKSPKQQTKYHDQPAIKPVSMQVQSISGPPAYHPNNIHVKQHHRYPHRLKKTLRPVKWCGLTNQVAPTFAKQPANTVKFKSSFSRLLQESSRQSSWSRVNFLDKQALLRYFEFVIIINVSLCYMYILLWLICYEFNNFLYMY